MISSSLIKSDCSAHFEQINQISYKYIQMYYVKDIFTNINPDLFNIGLLAGQLPENEALYQGTIQSQIIIQKELDQEIVQQISQSVLIVGLRAMMDLFCRSIYNSKENEFESWYMSSFGQESLVQWSIILVVSQ